VPASRRQAKVEPDLDEVKLNEALVAVVEEGGFEVMAV
jgi:hypothetical protein